MRNKYNIKFCTCTKAQTLGFLHSDNDVRYFGDDVPGVSQSFSEDQTFSYQDEEGTITVLGSPIKFDPPDLNFKEQ